MSRTYTGTVVSVDATEASPQVHVDLGPRRLALRASVRTALDAIPLVGRRVRFQAELSEHTQCLTSPVFVIGSAYGLRAVDGAADGASRPLDDATHGRVDVVDTTADRLIKFGGTRAR